MFESLGQQPRGMTPRDRLRLFAKLAAAVVLGVLVFGGGSMLFVPETAPPGATVAPTLAPTSPVVDLDLAALADLRAGAAKADALDADALEFVLKDVARDRVFRKARAPRDPAEAARFRLLSSATRLVGTPADVVAADPAATAGLLVEVRGRVAAIDVEGYAWTHPSSPRWLFALLVRGDDGATVAVLDAEVPRDRRPPPPSPSDDADDREGRRKARPPLAVGQPVHVRAYYLQKFGGRLGTLDVAPGTPVLVGRDYRPAFDAPPPPPALSAVVEAIEPDRLREQTWEVEDPAYWMTMHWVRSMGAARLAASLASGELPWRRWGRDEVLAWRRELAMDPRGPDGALAPDGRTFTNGARGRVHLLSGVLATYEQDDWERTPDNAYDLTQRFVYRLVSDHAAADLLIRFDSPFPLPTFPGVAVPEPDRPQRVRIHGVFLRNHSYVPSGAMDPRERERFVGRTDRVVTVPVFVALHLEPDPIGRRHPGWRNALLWAFIGMGLSLVFFVFVMRYFDRRDDAVAAARDAKRRAKIYGEVRARRARAAAQDASKAPVEGGGAPPDPEGPTR